MFISELWRYPVKSMGGEELQRIELGLEGIPGDRVVHARDGRRGKLTTARTRPKLLGHHATLGEDGEPLVDGRPWRSAEVLADVRRAAGDHVELARYDGLERFDVMPLLVATDGAIRAFGYDSRRLRPNIIIGGVEGLAERGWEGRNLRLGKALIRADSLRQRCIMTTFDPDSQEQNTEVLKHIQRTFDGKLALNCLVLEAGPIAIGDEVTIEDG